MHLLAYLKTGPTALHSGGWRHPEATLNDIFDPARYEQTAQVLEAARFDGAFFADLFGVADTYKGLDVFVQAGGQNSYLDPLVVLPLMARVTTRLGLGATISTSFQPPFQIARSLMSVDLLSKGRVAWNVVTSTSNLEAQNAGMREMPPHDERYERADEVLEACMALWKTWDPDPFIFDKRAGKFADPTKVHYANYQGRWTSTRGPLPSPRSPQGHPVIMQAGSSERGREFAARWAEVIFTRSADREFYEDMHGRLEAAGRNPESCKILPAVTPIIGETESIARERSEFLMSLEHPEYDLAYSSLTVGVDLSKHRTMQEAAGARGNEGTHGIAEDLNAAAQKAGVSFSAAAAKRDTDPKLMGTPDMIADRLEELFRSGACDGFVIMPTVIPTSHEQFCRAVVPELQRRHLFRAEYGAATLRSHLRE